MIKDAFKKKKNIMLKSSPLDLVTETDQAVEKFLFSELRLVFPDHSFIGEESVAAGDKVELTDAPTWIIDPVDGTMNFVHSFPFTCVSIGLTVNKEPVVGVIYNPILDHMYHARQGCGAFLNDEKISASGQTDLGQSLVIGELGTTPNPEKQKATFANVHTLVEKAHGFRSLGSCALVANSENMMRSKRGADIDAHDTVFRHNTPLRGFEEYVGRRSTRARTKPSQGRVFQSSRTRCS